MSDEQTALAQGEYLQVQAQGDDYEQAVARCRDLADGAVLGHVHLVDTEAGGGDWWLYHTTATVSAGGTQVLVQAVFCRKPVF